MEQNCLFSWTSDVIILSQETLTKIWAGKKLSYVSHSTPGQAVLLGISPWSWGALGGQWGLHNPTHCTVTSLPCNL